MCAYPFQLNQPISADRHVQPDDILRTKQALNRLGYYKSQYGLDGGWVDNDMFNGIRQLQKDNGLKVDGIVNPEGETESAINRLLENAGIANDNSLTANDNVAARGGSAAKCEHQYNLDSAICRMLPYPSRARCWSSASERLAACRTGKPLPRLLAGDLPTDDEGNAA